MAHGDNGARAALARCCDFNSYVEAVAELIDRGFVSEVPVLGLVTSTLPGFGMLRQDVRQRADAVGAPALQKRIATFLGQIAPEGRGEALCIAVDDPLCVAAAAVLCMGRQKRFAPLSCDAIVPERIAELIERYQPRSITFLTPPLLDHRTSCVPATQLLASLITALRACAHTELPVFGIITGADANALTQVVAKSVLWQEIFEYYADGQDCFVHEDAWPNRLTRSGTADPVRNPHLPAGLHDQPLSRLSRESVPRFAKKKRGLLVIKVHGRSYCAGKGLLCTARQMTTAPDAAVIGCVANFTCIGEPFLQFDPRRFDARLLVIDACDAISLQAGYWQWGNAAVGFLAAAGSPSAVLAADGLVVPVGNHGFDLLASAAGCHTIGEWSSQLNAMVRGPNPESSFVLFGDPDLPIGPTPWAIDASVETLEWNSSGAGRAWRLTIPSGAASLVRASLDCPAVDDRDVLYVWCETPSTTIEESLWTPERDASKVWLSIYGPEDTPVVIRAEKRPSIGLSHRLVEVARRALLASPSYFHGVVTGGWATVEIASDRLLKLDARSNLFTSSGGTIRADPYQLMRTCEETEALLNGAQAVCMATMAESISSLPNVYLPAIMWPIEMNTIRVESELCPLCGNKKLLVRDYQAGSVGWRSCHDCPQCCFIIEDKPRDVPSVLRSIDAPQIAAPGSPVTVRIGLVNPHDDHHLSGVLHASANLVGHCLRPNRSVFRFNLPPKTQRNIDVQLLPTGGAVLPHTYAIRVIALAEGLWHWRAHRFAIAEDLSPPASSAFALWQSE